MTSKIAHSANPLAPGTAWYAFIVKRALMLVFWRLIARSELDQDVDPLDLETKPPESAPLIIDFVILIEKMI